MANSWFSQSIIEQRLKNGHTFLDSVNKLIDWDALLVPLKHVHLRDTSNRGRNSYPKLVMLKALLLQQWYCLSDPELERCLCDRLSFIRFCGLNLEESVPDHSTICRFRNKLIEAKLHDKIFEEVNHQIANRGVSIRGGAAVDASLIQAHSRPRRKDYIEIEPTGDDEQSPTNSTVKFTRVESIDPDARWIKKGKRSVYGYKANASVDLATGIVQKIVTTSANVHDIKTLPELIEHLHLEEGSPVLADKGYSSKAIRELLRQNNLKPRIMFKRYKNDILRDVKIRFNRRVSKGRYIVEQTFGCLHAHYGFGRTRFVGLQKTDYFLTMKCVAFNLKKLAKLSNVSSGRGAKLKPLPG